MKVTHDNWLGEVLGYPAFRVALEEGEGEGASIPLELLPAGHAFLFAKVPTQQVGQAHALSRAGFFVVDVNLTFERAPAWDEEESARFPVEVHIARPGDAEVVLGIAESCFVYSRFHLDPVMPTVAANRVKREWIRNYLCGKRGEQLLVATLAERPVGFLAVLAAQVQGRRIRVIDLVGVDRDHQGRGAGRSLVQHFTRDSAGRCDLVRVGTQAANVPSVRLYEQCGYRLAESAYVLHAHARDGRIVR